MNIKTTVIKSYFFLCCILLVISCAKESQPKAIEEHVSGFLPSEVKLLDGPFKHAQDLNRQILLNYEVDRLLSRFRKNAGLEPKAEMYGGWEAESLAGHSLGHYLSACALMFEATGDSVFYERVNYIVEELKACQEADGSGYLGAFDNGKEIFETQVAKGDIRSQGFDLNGIWSPFYTHHKVFAGLRDAYRLTGNKDALVVESKFADWVAGIVNPLDSTQMETLMRCEFGGMNEVMTDLYTDTGNNKYLDLADKFYHHAVLGPMEGHRDSLAGLHANTQIPKIIGLMKNYEATGDDQQLEVSEFFWDRVVHHHSYVTGGNGNHEYFGKPDQLAYRLSDETTETCNVYNMLKLSALLFENKPDAAVSDYYERALFNHMLSAQHPQSGHVIYNLSLEMGGFKTYQDPYGFTCCVGSGMESHAKHSTHIYYHNQSSLYITQLIASELNWADKGLTLTQTSKFPEEQGSTVRLNLKEDQKFDIFLRYPYWAEKGMEVLINGEVQNISQSPASFVKLRKTWKDGDVIEWKIPFTLRLETMPDKTSRKAFMYGPIVLAGVLGPVDDKRAYQADYVPVLITEMGKAEDLLKPGDGPLTFHFADGLTAEHISFKPFYLTHDERYSIFWDIFTQSEWDQDREAYEKEKRDYQALVAQTYDFFQPGEMQPERNHKYFGEDTHVVSIQGRKARQSERGGWFEFEMSVPANEEVDLVFEYWGGYTGSKTFDIVVDGQTVATQNISGLKDGSFITVNYPIPAELTKGKDKIKVKIAPHAGHRGGPLYGARIVRRIG